MFTLPDNVSSDDTLTKLNTEAELLTADGDFGRHYDLPNGWAVSVIRNQYSYGGRQNLFELCLFTPSGELLNDTVCGHLTPTLVAEYVLAAKLGLLPEQQPKPQQPTDTPVHCGCSY